MNYDDLEKLMKQNKISAYRLSKETGIPSSTISDWKTRRSVPKADKLFLIANYFGMGLDDLLNAGSDGTYAFPDDSGREEMKSTRVELPIIGEIRAGKPIITEESVIGSAYADADSLPGYIDDYFYLKVRGDSMKNCGMIDGSLVLFHKQQYACDGEIVACLTDSDSATVKRFQRKGDKIYLIPENNDYDPITLNVTDFETGEARILGVAIEVKIVL